MEQALRLEDKLQNLENESPQARPRRILSTKSAISISSSLQSLPQQFIQGVMANYPRQHKQYLEHLQSQRKGQAQARQVDHLHRIINNYNDHSLLRLPPDIIKEDSGVVGVRHAAHYRQVLPPWETGARKKKPNVVAEGLVKELAGAVVEETLSIKRIGVASVS
ncbi:uncharacterized protein KD926_000762 [Aspergillus affinis]|uniref:uncharacterized protein n=1 Tax=Aspergillus affinis TaxID=1070780 RepID=UPI0022FDCCE8|nr:uncharacterized protein KD926_000762 [Aspergillus affinis]KAI9037189.1 hypothetical protein KD926_000762 [Aspergillus affinis]